LACFVGFDERRTDASRRLALDLGLVSSALNNLRHPYLHGGALDGILDLEHMASFNLEIAEDILDEARIPPDERAAVLKRELAVQLYAREILPKAAARRLSGMERVAFDELLGQRGIPSRLTVQDLDEDLANLAAYRAAVGRSGPG
jgi:predicted HTH domain antitoxin